MAAKKSVKKTAAQVQAKTRAVVTKAVKTAKRAVKTAKKTVKAKAKAVKVPPIPVGYHVLTPSLVVRGADKALAFYEKAFGAREKYRIEGPGGVVLHAELRLGDSTLMLGEEAPEMGARAPQTVGGTATSVMIYTKDVDQAFGRAIAAGAKVLQPPTDMFWGDRFGKLEDPFGHHWAMATAKEKVSPKEMKKRMAAAYAAPAAG